MIPPVHEQIENINIFPDQPLVLIDADEVVPDMLWDEIKSIISERNTADAYMVKKGFHFLGKKMKFGGFLDVK